MRGCAHASGFNCGVKRHLWDTQVPQKEPYCTWEKDIDVDRVKASTDTIYRGYGTKTKKAINRHLPFGLPDSDGDNEVLLAQKNYINWYDKDLRTSL